MPISWHFYSINMSMLLLYTNIYVTCISKCNYDFVFVDLKGGKQLHVCSIPHSALENVIIYCVLYLNELLYINDFMFLHSSLES